MFNDDRDRFVWWFDSNFYSDIPIWWMFYSFDSHCFLIFRCVVSVRMRPVQFSINKLLRVPSLCVWLTPNMCIWCLVHNYVFVTQTHTYHSIPDRVGFFSIFSSHSFIHSFMFFFFFTHRPCTHDAVLSKVSCVYHKNHTQHNFGNVFFLLSIVCVGFLVYGQIF